MPGKEIVMCLKDMLVYKQCQKRKLARLFIAILSILYSFSINLSLCFFPLL